MLSQIALVSLATGGCENNGPYAGSAGSYVWPQAIIGLPIESDEEQAAVREILAGFAGDYDLEMYRYADSTVPRSMREDPSRARTMEYHPIPAWLPEGIQVDLMEVSSECWLIDFYDRSPRWASESVSAFHDLHERLTSAAVPEARAFVEPVLGEDYRHRYESGVSVRYDELCGEMDVSAAVP